jgi:NAD-dependent SIR2 family protein deacetylase
VELHGNSFREKCKLCKKEYQRDFVIKLPTREEETSHDTNRKCESCKGALSKLLWIIRIIHQVDCIVNYGEKICDDMWKKAVEFAKKAELIIVLGTSLLVKPAMDIPSLASNFEEI